MKFYISLPVMFICCLLGGKQLFYSQSHSAIPIDIPLQNKIEMVYVEGGVFQMGSLTGSDDESPLHEVRLSDYEIGKYEVSQAQWREVMGNNPSYLKGDGLPVENISWVEAQEFAKRLSQKTGNNYRLPTEAEWEYAARGGKKSMSYHFSGNNNLSLVAWYANNAEKQTHLIGRKQPNELGIYDMSGNVWELCQDWYAEKYYEYCLTNKVIENPVLSNRNGQFLQVSRHRVCRGGAWNYHSYLCRSTFRCWNSPNFKDGSIGLRIVRGVP